MMAQWEYKITKLAYSLIKGILDTQTELFLLGKEGWEAVGIWEQGGNTYVMLKRSIKAKEQQNETASRR